MSTNNANTTSGSKIKELGIFAEAARLKVRFKSPVGLLSTEDLFDLPLTSRNGANLDLIAIGLNKEIKEYGEGSFVSTSTVPKELVLKFEIVKAVIAVRQEENQQALDRKERAAKKAVVAEMIAKKEVDAIGTLSLEDLKKLHETL